MRTALSAALVAAAVLFHPLKARAQAPAALPTSASLRLHLGMWTSHLSDIRRGLDTNWLVAVGWRGAFGGTFINSFGDRAFALGIERAVSRIEDGRVARGVGYRLGLVTGYDERLVPVASRVPVLPALQLTGDLSVGRTGVEVAWAGKVATVGPFMRVGY